MAATGRRSSGRSRLRPARGFRRQDRRPRRRRRGCRTTRLHRLAALPRRRSTPRSRSRSARPRERTRARRSRRGWRRWRPRCVLHLHVVEQQTKALQCRKRLEPALFGKLAVTLDPGAEPREHLLVEDRRRDPRRSGIDDEADRVGSDVDDRLWLGMRQNQRPRLKRSLGTLRPFLSAWPRPDRLGFDMK